MFLDFPLAPYKVIDMDGYCAITFTDTEGYNYTQFTIPSSKIKEFTKALQLSNSEDQFGKLLQTL